MLAHAQVELCRSVHLRDCTALAPANTSVRRHIWQGVSETHAIQATSKGDQRRPTVLRERVRELRADYSTYLRLPSKPEHEAKPAHPVRCMVPAGGDPRSASGRWAPGRPGNTTAYSPGSRRGWQAPAP